MEAPGHPRDPSTILRSLLLAAALCAGTACSGGEGTADAALEAGFDAATAEYCATLQKKCAGGDKAACQELSGKCPFTVKPDQGRQ